MTDHIVVTDEGAVRIIRMSRPEKKNALTLAMYAEIMRAMREADQNGAIHCLMLAGLPGVFTAGNDITDFLNASAGGFASAAIDFLHVLARNQKPMVAAVNGIAIGIGTTMVLHCDHVVAAADATFATPFLKLGLIPEAASTLLAPMRMGYARAFSLLAMGRPLTAEQAREAGIVNVVVDATAVEDVALKAAREIADLPPQALAVARELMRPREDIIRRIDVEAAHFKKLLQSDEARAAFQAFLGRKK